MPTRTTLSRKFQGVEHKARPPQSSTDAPSNGLLLPRKKPRGNPRLRPQAPAIRVLTPSPKRAASKTQSDLIGPQPDQTTPKTARKPQKTLFFKSPKTHPLHATNVIVFFPKPPETGRKPNSLAKIARLLRFWNAKNPHLLRFWNVNRPNQPLDYYVSGVGQFPLLRFRNVNRQNQRFDYYVSGVQKPTLFWPNSQKRARIGPLLRFRNVNRQNHRFDYYVSGT